MFIRKITGITFIVLGILAGIYCGVWFGLVGGLVQGLPMVIHGPIVPDTLVMDILRVGFFEIEGLIPLLIGVFVGSWIYPGNLAYQGRIFQWNIQRSLRNY